MNKQEIYLQICKYILPTHQWVNSQIEKKTERKGNNKEVYKIKSNNSHPQIS